MGRETMTLSRSGAATELASVRAAFSEFAYIVSHDLNAPLRESSSFSKFLVEKYGESLEDQARQYLAHVIHGCTQAQAMLDGLLRYSRLNTAAQPIKEGVDTGKLVSECVENVREQATACGAKIQVHELPIVRADSGQLRQLFACLLDNGLKFHNTSGTPRIAVSGGEYRKGWRFCVRDNGIGIPSAHFEEIFKPLKRLHGEQLYPGVGMGLALARKIVERHGGTIWVESEPGLGAAFWFTLSRITEEKQAA